MAGGVAGVVVRELFEKGTVEIVHGRESASAQDTRPIITITEAGPPQRRETVAKAFPFATRTLAFCHVSRIDYNYTIKEKLHGGQMKGKGIFFSGVVCGGCCVIAFLLSYPGKSSSSSLGLNNVPVLVYDASGKRLEMRCLPNHTDCFAVPLGPRAADITLSPDIRYLPVTPLYAKQG